MKKILWYIAFAGGFFRCAAQDSSAGRITEVPLSFGTFNTLNAHNKLAVNPAMSGFYKDFYFENRYNYEADNSASINIGKRLRTGSKHIEIIPMTGLVVGSFKGVTGEVQAYADYNKWSLSTDNQFSWEYTQSNKSVYLNWSVARYKITPFFHVGLTSVITDPVEKRLIFDRGVTALLLYRRWSMRFYAFNFEPSRRYFWLSLRYNIKIKVS